MRSLFSYIARVAIVSVVFALGAMSAATGIAVADPAPVPVQPPLPFPIPPMPPELDPAFYNPPPDVVA
ncbi:hypothetical protein ACIA76_03475, partial [Nocardia sp. NPDC051570]